MKRKLVQNLVRSEPKMMMVPAVETKPKPIDTIQSATRRVVNCPLQPHCIRAAKERQALDVPDFRTTHARQSGHRNKTPHGGGER